MIDELVVVEREDLLNRLLLDYVEACEAGLDPDRTALLTANPELQEDLAAFFASHDDVERLAAPLRGWNPGSTEHDSEPALRQRSSDMERLGDFHLIREVGRGGMGVVYEAEQISLRRRVALKVLPFAAAIDPRQLQRFQNEAAAAAHLRHENIVPVYAVGSDRGVHYYAMQFIAGQSLAAFIADLRQQKARRVDEQAVPAFAAGATTAAQSITERSGRGRTHFDWIAALGRQAALALEHAHQTGIVHRDIKPGNLLLDAEGRIWVADFGLAQVIGDGGLTATGELLGTLRYASPEQVLGRRGVVDHRSDIYSLGATLYELLTLSPPFNGRDQNQLFRQIAEDEPAPPQRLEPAAPPALATIVLKALRKDPGDRYATAQEFADDLQRFLERRPILARRTTVGERARMWTRRHPAAVLAAGAILVLVAAGSVFSMALLRGEQERTHTEQQRAEEAYRRERQRAEEAEMRLGLARRAVDELIQVSEEDLANRPGMVSLRKRLLRSALIYYQEIVEKCQDDPRARAEYLDTTRRIERILADLAVLRAVSHFYLLYQPAVLADLNITPQQEPRLRQITARVGRQWAVSLHDIGQISPSERKQRTLGQARINEAALGAILTPAQQTRLNQIRLQSDGPGAFHDPEVAAALGLTAAQRERIRTIEDEAMFGWMRPASRGAAAEHGWEAKERSLNDRILAVLTGSQMLIWRELTGPAVPGALKALHGSPVPNPPTENRKGPPRNRMDRAN